MGKSIVPNLISLVQAISIVFGVVFSVVSFNATQEKEALARQVEAATPFLQLRQTRYTEALHAIAILVNPETHTPAELADAKKRFRELYVAELSMVEAPEVASGMVNLAEKIDPELVALSDRQSQALTFAHTLRDSFLASWRISQSTVDRSTSTGTQ